MSSRLHLPSLTVEGFRGIPFLKLPSLGRVTLLVAKNSTGKTTVLEAIRIYASRGDNRSLFNLIDTREEFVLGYDEEGDEMLFPDFASLFHGHGSVSEDKSPTSIKISDGQPPHRLSLGLFDADKHKKSKVVDFGTIHPKVLRVSVGQHERTVPIGPVDYHERRRPYQMYRLRMNANPETWPKPIVTQSLGPGLPDNDYITRLWDEVALTDAEDFVTETLRMVVGNKLERLAVIGELSGPYRSLGRRFVARHTSFSRPIPLRRLGDGAQRLLGIALALANCQNGILLIDEVENGIHYSLQPALWRMIFDAAERGNLQVIAATHSWDCLSSFANAASESETSTDGVLYRLERVGSDLRSVSFGGEDLSVAAKQMIEVR